MFQPGHGYGSHISSTRSLWVRPPPFVPASLDPIHPIRPSTGSETVLGHHPLRPAAHRQRWWDEAGRPRGADRRGEEQRSRRVWARVTGVEAVFRWVEGWEMLGGFRRLGKHNDAGKVQSTDMLEQHPALAVVHIYTYIYISLYGQVGLVLPERSDVERDVFLLALALTRQAHGTTPLFP